MQKLIHVLLAVVLVGVAGCAVQVSSQYAPSVLLEGKGDVTIADFSYEPEGYTLDPASGKYYKSPQALEEKRFFGDNQIYTFSGLTPVFLDKPVAVFVTESIKKELKFIGYSLTLGANRVISGAIKEASIDYIGYTTCDYVFKIQFNINNSEGGVLSSKLIEGRYSEGKFTSTGPTSGLYTALAKAIENFVKSAQAEGIL
jgi:hypothetical protein